MVFEFNPLYLKKDEILQPQKVGKGLETDPQKQQERAKQVESVLQSFVNGNMNNPKIPPLGVAKTPLALAKVLLGDEVKPSDSEEDIYNKVLKKFGGDVKALEKYLKFAENHPLFFAQKGLTFYLRVHERIKEKHGEEIADEKCEEYAKEVEKNPALLSDEGADAFLAIEEQYADSAPETYYSSGYYGIDYSYDPLLTDALMMILEAQQEISDFMWELELQRMAEEKKQEEINKKKAEEKHQKEKAEENSREEKRLAIETQAKAAADKLAVVQVFVQDLNSGEMQNTGVVVSQIDDVIDALASLSASIEGESLMGNTKIADGVSATISNLEKLKTNLQNQVVSNKDELTEMEGLT
jgi:hypothetical protein